MEKRYNYEFTPFARRQFKKLPVSLQTRIIAKLDYIIQFDNPFVFVSRLKEVEDLLFRVRVGDYRLVFDIEGERTITIHRIGHRREIYK